MDARTLMISDFVKSNKGNIIKVESISTKSQNRKIGYHNGDMSKISYIRQGQIEPIILTENILRGNGFIHDGSIIFDDEINRSFSINIEDKYVWGYYCKDGFDFVFGESNQPCNLYIKYFHELQHALRLYGLTDFANNLKYFD